MPAASDTGGDPTEAEVVGVPPGTPPEVEPSATGLVTGPLDEEPDVDIAEVDVDPTDD
ncbi:MAG TPA: hypothetical protein VJ804_10420 [Acidimicrobiales bacterium]|nr:hypothetical protein [Acidimicrobiales bacterium]